MAESISNKLIVAGFALIDQNLPVFTHSAWEDHVQAWYDAEREVTERRWQQAAICASIVTHLWGFGMSLALAIVRSRE
jgi:hypothetical protein